MDKDDLIAITDYLTKRIYPSGLSKSGKRNMRKKAESFRCINGVLYHQRKKGKQQLVVTDYVERQKIISRMHMDASGNSRTLHNGIGITHRKISEWYWWRRMTEDVRMFCKRCQECRSAFFNKNQSNVRSDDDQDSSAMEADYLEPEYIPPLIIEQKELKSSSYSCELLSGLRHLYEEKLCFDVVLSAGGLIVEAHKLILMAASDILKSLVTDQMNKDETIFLTNIPGPCLEPIVSYLYTGALKLSKDNVMLMSTAASQLGITSAVALCQQYLDNSVDNNLSSGFDEITTDGWITMDIKEEFSNTLFNTETSYDSSIRDVSASPIKVEPICQEKRKRSRSKKINYNDKSDDLSYEEEEDNEEDPDWQMNETKVKSTRLTKVSIKKENVSSHRNLKQQKQRMILQKSNYKTIKCLLIDSRGSSYGCRLCNCRFRFSSGLIYHQRRQHGLLRLDFVRFYFSRWLLKSVIRSSVSSKSTADAQRKKLNFQRSSSHRMRSASFGFGRYSSWLKLLKLEKLKCKSAKNNNKESDATTLVNYGNKCGWCGQTFKRRSDLLDHRKLVHHKPKIKSGVARPKRLFLDWNCKEKECACLLKTKEELNKHMKEKHPNVFLSCPKCCFKTQVDYFLKKHLGRRHKDRYFCQICSRAFHKPSVLKIHLFGKHKIEDPTLKLYRCSHENCKYASVTKTSLEGHMHKHSSLKPFTCHICAKEYKRSIGLDRHISKVHLGIRPYVCDKCGVSCCDAAELKRHSLRHDKSKSYSCQQCNFSTYDKFNFQSHMFSRHQVVNEKMVLMKCNVCSFVTNKKYRYNDHVKMHDNIRDIPCPECGKPFVTKKTMRQHIVKVHKQTTQQCFLCSYKTLTLDKLQKHMCEMHDRIPEDGASSPSFTATTLMPDVSSSYHKSALPVSICSQMTASQVSHLSNSDLAFHCFDSYNGNNLVL